MALAGGSFDVVCEIWCRNNEHLLETLVTVRALDGVGVVKSNTCLEIINEEYRIG